LTREKWGVEGGGEFFAKIEDLGNGKGRGKHLPERDEANVQRKKGPEGLPGTFLRGKEKKTSPKARWGAERPRYFRLSVKGKGGADAKT